MSEWYADKAEAKRSIGAYKTDMQVQVEPDPMLQDEVGEGELTVKEIASLSRSGYSRSNGGMHFADDEKPPAEGALSDTRARPNNQSIKLGSEDTEAVDCAWAQPMTRIVSHQGQGGMQMPGNTKGASRPKPAYARNDLGGFYTS